jgi:hypothetical protein
VYAGWPSRTIEVEVTISSDDYAALQRRRWAMEQAVRIVLFFPVFDIVWRIARQAAQAVRRGRRERAREAAIRRFTVSKMKSVHVQVRITNERTAGIWEPAGQRPRITRGGIAQMELLLSDLM